MSFLTRRGLILTCATCVVTFAPATTRAATVFLYPLFFSDLNEFNSQNYFTAQAYDPTVPLNVGSTTSPAPTGTSFPSQSGFVQALPGGQAGSMNEYALSQAGLNFTTNQTAVSDLFNNGSASAGGQLFFGTNAAMPYALVNSFVYQATHHDADHPESWDASVTLTDVTTAQILYRQNDAPDFSSVLGSAFGTLPASHVFKLEFSSHTFDTSPDGPAFGNGVLNFAFSTTVPEPTCGAFIALLLIRRRP